MPLAQSPGLMVLAFVGGFALATLVFWPLLHRSHKPETASGSRGSGSTGKHALGTRPATNPANLTVSASKHATRDPAGSTVAAKSSAGDRGSAVKAAVLEEAAAPVRPQEDPADEELAPNDLFEQHHAAKFDQARQRLTKMRVELGGG